VQFPDINISQGSVATCLRSGGIFYDHLLGYIFTAESLDGRLKIDQCLARVVSLLLRRVCAQRAPRLSVFLPRDAMHSAAYATSPCLSVRPSRCLSHYGNSLTSSNCFHILVITPA